MGVEVGGDESVMWHAEGDNVRKDNSLKHQKKDPYGWTHEGVDEADGDFTVKIKIPNDRAGLYKRIRDAVTAAEGDLTSETVTFTLPIQFGQHKQIQIDWISNLSNPHAAKKLAKASLKSGAYAKKKATSAKAKKKTSGKVKKKTSGKAKKKTSKKR